MNAVYEIFCSFVLGLLTAASTEDRWKKLNTKAFQIKLTYHFKLNEEWFNCTK